MSVEYLCKGCNRAFRRYNTAQTRCGRCQLARSKQKPPKPIRQQGKHARLWQSFRDKVAKPYLDKRYGHVCSVKGCGATTSLDVDHIKNRGSAPHLRYDVKNMQYLCRDHHRRKTDGKLNGGQS